MEISRNRLLEYQKKNQAIVKVGYFDNLAIQIKVSYHLQSPIMSIHWRKEFG